MKTIDTGMASILRVAIGVVVGLLLFAGLARIYIGVQTISTASSPIYDQKTRELATAKSGRYYYPEVKEADENLARGESEAKHAVGVAACKEGMFFCIPFVITVIVFLLTAKKRATA